VRIRSSFVESGSGSSPGPAMGGDAATLVSGTKLIRRGRLGERRGE
jgi:hypothetical protein